MKFSTAIVPVVATLCSVLANGEGSYARTPAVAKPVSFTEDGVNNAIQVGIKSSKGDPSKSIPQAMAFFKRNPKIVQSALAEADKKEHDQAKAEAMKILLTMHKAKGEDLYDAKLKAVTYAYEHPELLTLVQKVIFRVVKDNPTLVDDLFVTAEKVVKKDPSIGMAVKDYVIKFSETNEKEYKELTEMVIKTALINPSWAGDIFIHLLKVDRIGCNSMSENCSCKGEAAITEGEPSGTSPSDPEPTPIGEGEGEGEGSTDEPAEGAGEIGSETSPTTPVPSDYSGPEAGEDSPTAEGDGSIEPESEDAPAAPATETPGKGGEAPEASGEDVGAPAESAGESSEEPEAAGEDGAAPEAAPAAETGSDEPLGYARPAPPKPLGYARPAAAAQ